MISDEDKKKLLNHARASINSFFDHKEVVTPQDLDEVLSRKSGVFVTLKKNGELRGCIGYTEPFYPLMEGVKNAAHAAAFNDPRFDPVEKEELDKINIEISVLTEPELLEAENPEDYPKNIRIGTDGLILKAKDGRGGLLLPQVAEEQGWDAKQFLEHLGKKASINKDAWKNPANDIYRFQVEHFDEKSNK
ncbi:MAG: AmmeMemoRadiSam system protein A [Nanobdellota archaeon]